MQVDSPIRTGRRYGWLPVLALTAAALAGCSSSGGGNAAAGAPTAAPPSSAPVTAAPSPTAPSPTATSPAEPTSGTAPTGTPAAPPGKRPAEACPMLTSEQIVTIVGTSGPFRGTRLSPASDGSPVWGCTWGSRESYAAIHEVSATVLASVRANPELEVTPMRQVGQDAVLSVWKKDSTRPVVYFTADGHTYSVEVVKSRAPGDGVNAPAEVMAEGILATLLAKALTA
ncbi:hypothetical protein ACGFZP_28695 [Kitasatospora sp. NPDC048239]|uniref:hypothetical protein n=1 Tax=Kitasatospora sp. NPDC048239 TaxID=3364046 RepID=UPI0037220FAA